ncbi:MAG: methyltransferase domain-containing protein [Chloroflexota bacterium]|nr:methyltransferase domain-containing protein [Chloroflexota bacterium]
MNDGAAVMPPSPLTPPSSPAHTSADLLHMLRTALPDLDPALEAAFLRVERAHFLPTVPLEQVYQDNAIPIKTTLDGVVVSSSSQPSMMATMLDQLDLRVGDNVLEIGAGSGYNAALMHALVGDQGRVTSVEIDGEVAETALTNLQRARMGAVNVVTGDGAQGYALRAAYDRILATAAVWDVPRAWVRQLRPSGRLVVPIALDGFQVSAAFVAGRDGSLTSIDNHVCAFVWMQGQLTPVETVRIGGGLYLDTTFPLDSAALTHLLSDDAEDGYLAYTPDHNDLWRGFLPYLALHLPLDMHIVSYHSLGRDYGITGTGFGLFTQGSACFLKIGGTHHASNDDALKIRYFGAADTYLTLQDTLSAWVKAGHPDQSRLRVRLIPIDAQPLGTAPGRVYRRRDHLLQAWLEL